MKKDHINIKHTSQRQSDSFKNVAELAFYIIWTGSCDEEFGEV